MDLREIAAELIPYFPQLQVDEHTARLVTTLSIAEEAGELVGAVRRYLGHARRSGDIEDIEQELADIVITAFVMAELFDIDLPAAIDGKLGVIYSRGWKEASNGE